MCLSTRQTALKRTFDVVLASIGLFFAWWIILVAWVAATIDTRKNGLFSQSRVGLHGKKFRIKKIRTMRQIDGIDTTVTSEKDPRITRLGSILRRSKIDELPQLFNIILGDMSFVGPRPDVPGFADSLSGEERKILTVRPGITGPATLKFRNEEQLLGAHRNPEAYNREVIFPEKVKINLDYIKNWSLAGDVCCIWQTIFDHQA